jgi:hypothetical protein
MGGLVICTEYIRQVLKAIIDVGVRAITMLETIS